MSGTSLVKTIARSIRERRMLRVVYEGRERIVEPYLVYATKAGDLILHGRQIAGAYFSTPPPDWCNLRLSEISSAATLPEKFVRPHRDYNPASSQFHRVIHQLADVSRSAKTRSARPRRRAGGARSRAVATARS